MRNVNNVEISVVVPVYNVEPYLNKCIESILLQSINNFELLLINDGSLDCSGRICDEYAKKDNRVKVFHKANEGVSLARNLGLYHAQGEWIIFIDGDDWIIKDALSFLLKIAKEKDIDLIRGEYFNVDTDDNILGCSNYRGRRSIYKNKVMNGEFFLTNVFKKEFFSWLILFKRSFLLDNKLKFPPHISMCEDALFLIKCNLIAQRACYIDIPFYAYRINPLSVSSNLTYNNLVDLLTVLKEINKLLISNRTLKKELNEFITKGVTILFSSLSKQSKNIQDEILMKIDEWNLTKIVIAGRNLQKIEALIFNLSPRLLLWSLKQKNLIRKYL